MHGSTPAIIQPLTEKRMAEKGSYRLVNMDWACEGGGRTCTEKSGSELTVWVWVVFSFLLFRFLYLRVIIFIRVISVVILINHSAFFFFCLLHYRYLQVIKSVRFWFLKMGWGSSVCISVWRPTSADVSRITSVLLNTLRDCSFQRCLSHSFFLHWPLNVRIPLPSDVASYPERTKPQLQRNESLSTNITFVSDPTICNAATWQGRFNK